MDAATAKGSRPSRSAFNHNGCAQEAIPLRAPLTSPDNAPWGVLEWAIAGLASVGASAAAFIWRLMTRLHTLEITVRQHRHDLETAQSANEAALLRFAERMALLHDDHYRLRETIGALPTRGDIHDLEIRLAERMDALAARFDRALDLRG